MIYYRVVPHFSGIILQRPSKGEHAKARVVPIRGQITLELGLAGSLIVIFAIRDTIITLNRLICLE